MKTRVFTGLLAIPLFLAFCFAREIVFLAFVTLLVGAGLVEWSRVYGVTTAGTQEKTESNPTPTLPLHKGRGQMLNPFLWIGLLLPSFAYFIVHKKPEWASVFNVLQIAGVLMFVTFTGNAAKTGVALGKFRKSKAGIALIGVVYVGGLLSGLVLLRSVPKYGVWALLTVVFCVWATDTFAYFVGRAFGKRKLAPTLSPKKTVEGAIGGLVGSAIVGAIVAQSQNLSPVFGIVIGIVAGVAGPLGDLWESALKREAGIKDFGAMLPGHGGVLDRFDSLLFVAPLAYLLWAIR